MLGILVGAGTVAFGSRMEAQGRGVGSIEERFVAGDTMTARRGPVMWSFQFFRDRQTGDCYITHRTPTTDSATLTKTDDNACDGM